MIFLYLWTAGVSLALPVLWMRCTRRRRELDDARSEADLAARQHHDTVAALRSTESRDSMVLESIDEIVFRLALVGDVWRVESVSPRIHDLLGYTPEEAIQLGAKIIHPADRDSVTQKTFDAFRHAGTITFQYRILHRDGHYRWFENRLRGVGPIGSQGPAVFGVGRDITEQMHSEEERRRSDEDVQQAHKMEALGRLAGGIAHDFNNLLTTIGGNASFVIELIPPGDTKREALEDILSACDRAARFTRQLLAFSRKQVLQPEPLHLEAVVGEMHQMLSRLLGPEYQLLLNIPPNLPPVASDRGQMEQVVMNLVVNARDAMPKGGPISVRARLASSDDADAIERMTAKPVDVVVLEVSDKGTGIPDEIKERIFEPFFTTKDRGKGTGLGLAMVYGFVRQSGGHVELITSPDQGTRFLVYLPAAATTEAPVSVAVPEAVDDRPLTILVVDDEPGVRHLAAAMLRRSGYSVIEAGDGKEAERVAADHVGEINVLLTDIVMPGLRGPELAKHLREERPTIRIVYMSGFRDTEPLADVERGEAVFLAKPFQRAALLGAISRVTPSTA